MRFPKRITLLLAKIALERVMSPNRAEELVVEVRRAAREIGNWWTVQVTDSVEATTVQEATDEVASTSAVPVSSDQKDEAAGIVRRIEDRLADRAGNREMSETLVGEIIESEIGGKGSTCVIWLDDAGIVGNGGGRYVHFSYLWDESRNRFGYRIRDFEQGIMFHPPNTQVGGTTWETRELSWTADEIWVAARRRIRTIKETGLGDTRLGSVERNKALWKEVLNVLTMNLPPEGQSERGS